jgi:hypothetical protein
MKTELTFTRLLIGDMWLEKDINNEPRIVMRDELGQEWSISENHTSHGLVTAIKKKEECYFFNEKNRSKEATSF